jgi:hypothetical protein
LLSGRLLGLSVRVHRGIAQPEAGLCISCDSRRWKYRSTGVGLSQDGASEQSAEVLQVSGWKSSRELLSNEHHAQQMQRSCIITAAASYRCFATNCMKVQN